MKSILVLYATREGQTQRIAEHIGAAFRERGFAANVLGAASLRSDFTPARYDAAILAASVHCGKHEGEMAAFVKSHRTELEGMRTAFLSVSGSQSGAERREASPESRARCAAEARRMIDVFLKETGWKPGRILPVAGALMYRKYNFLVRWVMRMIAKKEGGSTDTSRNTEYTDWAALDRFVQEFAAEFRDSEALPAAA